MHLNAELRVDMRWDTLIRVDKLAEPIGRKVNALHCVSIRYFGLAICNSCRLYYVRFQRGFQCEFDQYKNTCCSEYVQCYFVF